MFVCVCLCFFPPGGGGGAHLAGAVQGGGGGAAGHLEVRLDGHVVVRVPHVVVLLRLPRPRPRCPSQHSTPQPPRPYWPPAAPNSTLKPQRTGRPPRRPRRRTACWDRPVNHRPERRRLPWCPAWQEGEVALSLLGVHDSRKISRNSVVLIWNKQKNVAIHRIQLTRYKS